jgi:rhamnogalacturonyl hydrolase YesR
VFVDETNLAPDTAGSSGIAAALALGRRHGWLPASADASATRALDGLRGYFTSDGFLGGVAPANLGGGEPLQRSDYRVIFQMGMGLMAQLMAALELPSVK